MATMESELVSVRAQLKAWERRFHKTHARKPSRTDVGEHPEMGRSDPGTVLDAPTRLFSHRFANIIATLYTRYAQLKQRMHEKIQTKRNITVSGRRVSETCTIQVG